jgi:uncharacterized protein
LLPSDRIQVRCIDGWVVPLWLGAEDYPWLRSLVEEMARLDGRPYREARAFLQEPPRIPMPIGKRRMAIWILQSLCKRDPPPIDAASLRDLVSLEAQIARNAGRFDRTEALTAGARRLGLSPDAAEKTLFSDLPGERRLRVPNPLPEPHWLAVHTNLALAQGLLGLSEKVKIQLQGGARAVVRSVHLKRLLCQVRRAGPESVQLEISGPYSLFRHTTIYGRALASILPMLLWCERFELEADCTIRRRTVTLQLRSGDPIAVGDPPRAYDSHLEARFARDFARANLEWDLIREPEPVDAGGILVFPDFAVVHRRNPSRRFLLEIVGFWTPEYLSQKLSHLRSYPETPLVLCIDHDLNCGMGDVPTHARVVWFHRRIEPGAVVAALEQDTTDAAPHMCRISLGDLFIDWAGRYPACDRIHRRLAALKIGDSVHLKSQGQSVFIESMDGPIARLSGAAEARWNHQLGQIVSARLVAMVDRQADRSLPRWRARLQSDRWKVPIVEVLLRF